MYLWKTAGDFLAVQWLGLCASTVQGLGSILGPGTTILQASRPLPTKKKSTTYKVDWNHHHWASLVAQTVKNMPAFRETWDQSLGWGDPLEKEMAAHSSILAWRIPWTEEPGGLQSMGSQRVGHNRAHTHTNTLIKLFKFLFLDIIISSWTYPNFHEIRHSFVNIFRWYSGLQAFFFFFLWGVGGWGTMVIFSKLKKKKGIYSWHICQLYFWEQ